VITTTSTGADGVSVSLLFVCRFAINNSFGQDIIHTVRRPSPEPGRIESHNANPFLTANQVVVPESPRRQRVVGKK
jgi:hypothetical protein